MMQRHPHAEMSTPCDCATIGADPAVVTRCPHYHFFKGDKRLAGVNRVIDSVWPVKKSWEGVDMAVVDNARIRGTQVDSLFCAWLDGTLTEIPAGTREDAKVGFEAVRRWWDSKDRGDAKTQQVLHDDDVVGIPDVITSDGWLWDLKCSAKIESTYELQLGGYLDLASAIHWQGCGVIHCQFSQGGTVATVKPVVFEPMKALSEWRLLRQFWTMVQRKTR